MNKLCSCTTFQAGERLFLVVLSFFFIHTRNVITLIVKFLKIKQSNIAYFRYFSARGRCIIRCFSSFIISLKNMGKCIFTPEDAFCMVRIKEAHACWKRRPEQAGRTSWFNRMISKLLQCIVKSYAIKNGKGEV